MPGGNLLEESPSRLWLAPAKLYDGSDAMLYLKELDENRLLVHLLCAAVGHALACPCPPAFLVMAQPGHYGPSKAGFTFLFGSYSANHPDVARPLYDPALIVRNLKHAKMLELACVFDEWIANPNRLGQRMLFGSRSGPLFIDHDHAISPMIEATNTVKNWLLDEYKASLDEKELPNLFQALRRGAARAQDVVLTTDMSNALYWLGQGAERLAEMTAFLSSRLDELDKLLSERAIPSQSYIGGVAS